MAAGAAIRAVALIAIVARVGGGFRRFGLAGRLTVGLRRGVALGLQRAEDPVDGREGERGGLAGAGLGATDQVASFEDRRDRVGLDRRHDLVTLVGDRTEQRGADVERIELHLHSFFSVRVVRTLTPRTACAEHDCVPRPHSK